MSKVGILPETKIGGDMGHDFPDEDYHELSEEPSITRNFGSVTTNSIIIPLDRPLTWTSFAFLTFLCALPAALYTFLFTEMGYGLYSFYFLSDRFEKFTSLIVILIILLIFGLYLLDFSYWKGPLGKTAWVFSWMAVVSWLFLLVMFQTGNYPFGPICLGSMLVPIYLLSIKSLLFQGEKTKTVISWLSRPLMVVAFCTLGMWIVWILSAEENQWNLENQNVGADISGCQANFEDYPYCERNNGVNCVQIELSTEQITFPDGCSQTCLNVYKTCLNTFILWAGPLMMGMSMFFVGSICAFLSADSKEDSLIKFSKIWLLLLFVMWISASILGGGEGVWASLVAFTLACFVGSVVLFSVSFTEEEHEMDKLSGSVLKDVTAKYGEYFDLVKGLMVLIGAPLVPFSLLISAVNQWIRRSEMFSWSKKLKEGEEKEDWLTKKMRKQVTWFNSWDLAAVFSYTIYWGIAFVVMQVFIAQLTTLFLSWLISATSDYSLSQMTVMLIMVGILMFLLPPIPGIPIYMMFGITVVPKGRETYGLVGSVIYSILVTLALKLLACTMQQKCIGQALSKSKSVRHAVGINSHLIRTMKLILSEKGLSIAKVSILVGGPDWPTSVLCGIMRLGLCQVLIGTIPVIFIISPTVLAGTFIYMNAESDQYGLPLYPHAGTAATICTAITAFVAFLAMSLAAFHLEHAAKTRTEELKSMPLDEQVKEVEEQVDKAQSVYDRVTQWHLIPTWLKMTFYTSVMTMIISCYILQLLIWKCFAKYELTSTIQDDLDGNAMNFILPLGWFAIGLFLQSTTLFLIFTLWAKGRVRKISRPETEQCEKTLSCDISLRDDYSP